MRPDAIDWHNTKDQVSLTFLPRPHLGRTIWRRLAVVVVLQMSAMVGVAALLQGPWRLSERFAAGLDADLVTSLVAFAAGLAVALIGVLVLRRQLGRWTKGLRHLHEAIRGLAHGANPKPVPVAGDDEIAYLLIAFNDMAGKLLASRRTLIELNEDLERKVAQQTEELRVANLELERKNQTLAQLTDTALRFTDDVAHEFRTPLTVVMEFASIIADGLGGAVTAKQAEFLQFIIDASKDLATLVDDFLDSSKLRAHRLRVDRRSHSVQELLDSVWPLIEARAASKKVVLARKIDADVPAVFADLEKARRTIVNLVVNAIKFSKPSSTVTVAAHQADEISVQISITDQGPGLPPEELATLFERFKQAGEGRRSSAKGFGLGLNIVRDLVALNLGTINVQSAAGRGSTFSFTLPIDRPHAILDCYLNGIRRRAPETSVSVLRVNRDAPSADEGKLRSFLASATYPGDIALGCLDGRSLILVGETIESDRWRERLLRYDQEERQSHGKDVPAALRAERIGTWPLDDARTHIVSHVPSSAHMEVMACA